MVSQKTINRINKLYYEMNLPVHEIAARVRYSPCTIYKYLKEENKERSKQIRPPEQDTCLAKYHDIVYEWLLEDTKHFYKQRHTAQRVHDRLSELYADEYTYSYKTTRLLFNQIKTELKDVTPKEEDALGEFLPGEAEVACGSITIQYKGKKTDAFVVCLCFPYSKAAYLQICLDNNLECILQSLKDIYNYLNGVPTLQKFAPNTNLYKFKTGEVSNTSSELFAKFQLFYAFKALHFIPESEGAKTVVARLMQYFRRCLFKEAIVITDLQAFNLDLFKRCESMFERKPRDNKVCLIKELHQKDLEALIPLPGGDLIIRSYYKCRVSKTAEIRIEKNKRYTLPPQFALKLVYVYVYCDRVDILTLDCKPIISYPRITAPSDDSITDWIPHLPTFIRSPGALANTKMLLLFPKPLADFLRKAPCKILLHYAVALKNLTKEIDLQVAAEYLNTVITKDFGSGGEIVDEYYRTQKTK